MLAVVSILRRWVPVAGLIVLVLPAAGFAATITVNAASDPGTVGDGALSLTEAIRLATGDLSMGALSGAEGAQVSGTPGPASADTIAFSVGSISLTGLNVDGELLPPLDTGNDTIDGAGAVTLSGASANADAIVVGIHVSSSGNTITGLTFQDVPGTVILIQPPANATITGNSVLANHIVRPGIDGVRVLAARALPGQQMTGGTIQGTLIQGNTIETGGADNTVRGFGTGAMNFIAAYVPMAGGSISGASIRDTTLRGNTIQDTYQGVFVRVAVGYGPLSSNAIDGLLVEDNGFRRVTDSSLLLSSGTASGTGVSSDNLLHGVIVRRNVFADLATSGTPNQGGAIFMVSGVLDSCFDTTGTPTSLRDTASDIEISDNQVTNRGPYGIFLIASHSCGGAGGSLTESVLEDVRITGNTIAGCKTELSLQAASTVDTGADVTNASNQLRNVTVSGNTISGAELAGIEFIGAFSGNSRGKAGTTSGNTVSDVTVTANTVQDNDTGIVVNGTVAQGPVAGQSGNVITGLQLTDNTVSGSSFAAILLQTAIAGDGSRVTDNRIENPVISGNTVQSNRGLGIYLRPGATVGGGHAEGNTITGAQIAQNTILDTTMGSGNNSRAIGILLGGIPGNTLQPIMVADNTITRVDRVGISIVASVGHTIARNHVAEFGRKPFTGNKRKNKLIGNLFGPKARKKRKA